MVSSRESHLGIPRRILVILGLIVYVATGYIYLTSGLVVPGGWLLALWVLWLGGMWATGALMARWSWWTLASGPVAVAFWWTYLTVGENLLGWTP